MSDAIWVSERVISLASLIFGPPIVYTGNEENIQRLCTKLPTLTLHTYFAV